MTLETATDCLIASTLAFTFWLIVVLIQASTPAIFKHFSSLYCACLELVLYQVAQLLAVSKYKVH